MKKKDYYALLAMSAFFLLSPLSIHAERTPQGNEILAAASQWLTSIDQGQYEAGWENTAGAFKNNTDKEQWSVSLKKVRDRIGHIQERSLASLDYNNSKKNEMPLSCTLYFYSRYEHLITHLEMVILVYEESRWKVAGYALPLGGDHGL